MNIKFLSKLLITIRKNLKKDKRISYTSRLYSSGINGCKNKFLEEVREFIVSLKGKKKHTIHESADVFYHYLVLLERKKIGFIPVLEELKRRSKISGIEEKLRRKDVR